MLKINDFETASPKWFDLVISGMRNSWESWEKGDSEIDNDVFVLGDNDEKLANRLTRSGDDHGKYLRQIPILYSVTAPDYWFREFDTYVVANIPPGDVTQNSTSQMHTLGKQPFDESMFSWEDLDSSDSTALLYFLNNVRDTWIVSGKRKGPQEREWRALKQVIPDSWLYTRTTTANYMVLRHMYFARRNHRLLEWRQFCSFIETLPYANLICVE